MDELKELLEKGGYSCVIRNGNTEPRTFSQRGVADLYDLLHQEPELLQGAMIADKVVGKGGATLMAMGGIRKLYTKVISTPALDMLQKYGIETTFDLRVDNIINRDKTGVCPLEILCLNAKTKEDSFEIVSQFVRKIRNINT